MSEPEKIISNYWESVESTNEASHELENVERRMDRIDADDVADRAAELAKKVKQLHRDIDARMEEEAEMRGITQ